MGTPTGALSHPGPRYKTGPRHPWVLWLLLMLFAAALVFVVAIASSKLIFGRDDTPDLAALNAAAPTAASYESGKAFARALTGALPLTCTAGNLAEDVDSGACKIRGSTKPTTDIQLYVATPFGIQSGLYESTLALYKKTIAETRPVGETAWFLVGNNWFVMGDKPVLQDVQDRLGGRLVVVGG